MATHKKVFSRVLAKQFLRDVKGNTLNYVEGNGFFRNRTHSTLCTRCSPGCTPTPSYRLVSTTSSSTRHTVSLS